jgi:hypothetical protein
MRDLDVRPLSRVTGRRSVRRDQDETMVVLPRMFLPRNERGRK